jgi:hypothetical protein
MPTNLPPRRLPPKPRPPILPDVAFALSFAVITVERELIRERTGEGRRRANDQWSEVRAQAQAIGLSAPGSYEATSCR